MPESLKDFYTAFAPTCFSLLGLWLVIIGFNAGAWLRSADLGPQERRGRQEQRRRQAYAVALFFAAPGTMGLLALINTSSTTLWRVVFSLIALTGFGCVAIFGHVHHGRPHDALDISDHVVYWATLALYLAIAVLAMIPAKVLDFEGFLLTALVLVGTHVALRLMLAVEPEEKG